MPNTMQDKTLFETGLERWIRNTYILEVDAKSGQRGLKQEC